MSISLGAELYSSVGITSLGGFGAAATTPFETMDLCGLDLRDVSDEAIGGV